MTTTQKSSPEKWEFDVRHAGFCIVTLDNERGLENDFTLICQGYMGEKNARLIASAPQLLWQLEQVAETLRTGQPFPATALPAIEAAIKLAKGSTIAQCEDQKRIDQTYWNE